MSVIYFTFYPRGVVRYPAKFIEVGIFYWHFNYIFVLSKDSNISTTNLDLLLLYCSSLLGYRGSARTNQVYYIQSWKGNADWWIIPRFVYINCKMMAMI